MAQMGNVRRPEVTSLHTRARTTTGARAQRLARAPAGDHSLTGRSASGLAPFCGQSEERVSEAFRVLFLGGRPSSSAKTGGSWSGGGLGGSGVGHRICPATPPAWGTPMTDGAAEPSEDTEARVSEDFCSHASSPTLTVMLSSVRSRTRRRVSSPLSSSRTRLAVARPSPQLPEESAEASSGSASLRGLRGTSRWSNCSMSSGSKTHCFPPVGQGKPQQPMYSVSRSWTRWLAKQAGIGAEGVSIARSGGATFQPPEAVC
mmetsp:Transcript_75475/g.208930  ORF Transcript_75475/g.208930 Transcript_75475/m.208930 type:complete len:260 (+) Transcript_75475:176-955(+)